MKRSVPDGEELMPQRYAFDVNLCSAKPSDEDSGIPEAIPIDTQFVCTAAPVDKHSRKYMVMPCMIST